MAIGQILIRGGTSAQWAAANPVLAAREIAIDTTLKRVKIGDGQNAWSSLPWLTLANADVLRLEGAASQILAGGLARKFSANVPAGSTSPVITHSLNTLDVNVSVYEVTTGIEVLADVTLTSLTQITLGFATAPTAGQYRVVVTG